MNTFCAVGDLPLVPKDVITLMVDHCGRIGCAYRCDIPRSELRKMCLNTHYKIPTRSFGIPSNTCILFNLTFDVSSFSKKATPPLCVSPDDVLNKSAIRNGTQNLFATLTTNCGDMSITSSTLSATLSIRCNGISDINDINLPLYHKYTDDGDNDIAQCGESVFKIGDAELILKNLGDDEVTDEKEEPTFEISLFVSLTATLLKKVEFPYNIIHYPNIYPSNDIVEPIQQIFQIKKGANCSQPINKLGLLVEYFEDNIYITYVDSIDLVIGIVGHVCYYINEDYSGFDHLRFQMTKNYALKLKNFNTSSNYVVHQAGKELNVRLQFNQIPLTATGNLAKTPSVKLPEQVTPHKDDCLLHREITGCLDFVKIFDTKAGLTFWTTKYSFIPVIINEYISCKIQRQKGFFEFFVQTPLQKSLYIKMTIQPYNISLHGVFGGKFVLHHREPAHKINKYYPNIVTIQGKIHDVVKYSNVLNSDYYYPVETELDYYYSNDGIRVPPDQLKINLSNFEKTHNKKFDNGIGAPFDTYVVLIHFV